MNRHAILLLGLACAAPAPAAADEPALSDFPGGAIAISADQILGTVAVTTAYLHASLHDQSVDGSVIMIQPSLDYFVGRNVSLGGMLGVERISAADTIGTNSETIINVQVRGGVNFPLGDRVSIWIRAGLQLSRGLDDPKPTKITAIVFAPIEVFPARNFFLGLGPFVSVDLASAGETDGNSFDNPKSTLVGLLFNVGGHFGGSN